MKKVIVVLLVLALVSGFVFAQGAQEGQGAKWTVGICQLVQHPALDAATQGFKDALVKGLGDDVKIDEQNASGEPANCSTIVNGFVA